MRKFKISSILLTIFALLLIAPQLRAVAIYTITNADTINKPVDPFFLPPGEDVVDFYSYGTPVGSSANTGWEQYDTALVYLTLDDQNHYGLVVVMDRPGGGGGNADLFIEGFPTGAQVVVSDDAGEADPVQGDGTAVCDWNWIDCCTDGVAYDMGTNLDFTLNLDFVFNAGIDTLRFISFDPCSQGDMLFMDLDQTQTLEIHSVDIGGEIPDCNGNNQPDFCDIDNGLSHDCNGNEIPDECENDCNNNGYDDSCDISDGSSLDCNQNDIPDECEPDCNQNGTPDDCDLANGSSYDCNNNSIPDECENDCNNNGFEDSCDIAGGLSLDCNNNGIPDECDISLGTSDDCDGNGIPDDCQADCNLNGVADICDLIAGTSMDCNQNMIPDECDIDSGFSLDCNDNIMPDECETDCNNNGQPDDCDLEDGSSLDCNNNNLPDVCDIDSGSSLDENQNGIPDDCEEEVSANEQPADYSLTQNYPNPFNPSTMIEFSMSEADLVLLEIFDIKGSLVSVLWNGIAPRGQNEVLFDASALSSGIYVYRLTSKQGILSQRMLLLR
jgi:hypothetical protein